MHGGGLARPTIVFQTRRLGLVWKSVLTRQAQALGLARRIYERTAPGRHRAYLVMLYLFR